MLESMRREDPVPIPKLAVPPTVPAWIQEVGLLSSSPKKQAIGDLAVIAFYYLLRVGEYTIRNPKKPTRTHQFRVMDVTFWRDGNILPNSSPLKTLLTADEATLRISNQKNGTRGQLIHHQGFQAKDCPVRALAHRVAHITQHTKDDRTILSTYFDAKGYKHRVTSDQMNKAVKQAIIGLNLAKTGITPDIVGSHSLRAGGAMAMKLNGIDRDTIRKMGRWSSDTFLMYVHEQIAFLSAGLAKTMSTRVPFRNVAAGATLREPPAAAA